MGADTDQALESGYTTLLGTARACPASEIR